MVRDILMAGSKLSAQIDALKKMSEHEIQAGWFPENVYPNGQQVAQVMFWNEFGTPNAKHPIPARPLFRQSAAKIEKKLPAFLVRRAADVMNGKLSPEELPKLAGEAIVGEIVREFKDGGFVPNSKSTERAKGFNVPLTDTGHAAQSVQYKIKEKE